MTRLTCHHNKTMRSKTASAGFTMVELLAVVGILAIVGLIAVFSLGRLRLDLRQRELDSKAELLYTAAQKQMAELHAAGWEGWYQPGADGVVTMPFPPSDADEESQKTTFCYVLANTAAEKETTAAAAILPMSAVDAELWDGCWYIEYAPDSGSVYAVFYSASLLPEPNTLDDYRSYQYRRRMGAKVGYYGGDIAQAQQTGTLQGRTQGEVQDDRTHGGGHAVYKGDAACNFGQRLRHGVFLTKDVHIAEVAQERVGQHVQQQAGTGRNDHLDEIAGAVLVEVAQLECLVRHGTAGDADDELEHKGGDGIARVTGQNIGQRQTNGTGQTAGHTVQQ